MLLIGRIGAEYAAYVTLLMPIIALILSTLFEGYLWTANAVVGVALVLAGNLIILTPQIQFQRIKARVKDRQYAVKAD
jgi:drug/metabolite transporter (DMT)-like permease